MIDLKVETTLFQSDTISFKLPVGDPRLDYLIEDYELEFEGRKFFITEANDEHSEDNTAYKIIEAEESWMKLADPKQPGSTIMEGTAAEQLRILLEPYGWAVVDLAGEVDATVFSLEATDASVLDICWQWAKVCYQELKFYSYGKYVAIAPTIGIQLPYSFRYGKNVRNVKRTVKPPKVTRLYAYGRNDLDLSSHTGGVPYLENYSYYTSRGLTLAEARARYRKDEIWQDDSFIESSALFTVAQQRLSLQSQANVFYEMSVVDLSSITDYYEGDYECGDTVWGEDELLGISQRARVVRRIRYPYEPERDEVELSFNPVPVPDNTSSSARSDTTKSWELFVSRNEDSERRIQGFSTILHRIGLRTIEGAEWALHYNLHGVANGNSTITLEFSNDEVPEPFWMTRTFTLVDGQAFDFQFSYGDKEIPAGEHSLVIRAYSNTPGSGLIISPGQTAFWILARGTTRQNVTLPNSVTFNCTGAIQYFNVPDDVHELLVECNGSAGTYTDNAATGGGGGMVKALIPVVSGETLAVYVGCMAAGSTQSGGWPNGGATPETAAGDVSGGSGGGSTHLQRGLTFNSSGVLILAAGGGGGNQPGFSRGYASIVAGNGGFYKGTSGNGLPANYDTGGGTNVGGGGATQSAGGLAGVTTSGPGSAGSFNQGGAANSTGNSFHFGGGGGGGGYYGGGGAGHPVIFGGGSYAGDGGGGSGYLGPTGFDLEFTDGVNQSSGTMIISWETPDSPA